MNQRINQFLVFLCITVVVAAFGGCSRATEFFQYQTEPEKQVEVVKKGILSIDRISTLNPVTARDRDVYYLNKLLYRSLFELDETLKAREDLVLSYQMDEAARILTLELDPNARWADGTPIRPEDVQFTIEAYKRASYTGQTLYGMQVAPILQVRIQDNSVILRYGWENEFCLEDLTFPILSQKNYKDYNQALKSEITMLPMTSGPYKIFSFNPYSELVLEGNPQYPGHVPDNQLVFRIIPKESENLNLIDPNLITVAYSEKLTRDVDYSNLKAEMESFLSNEAEWIGFNTTRLPFDNSKMRKAIALAVNTEKILDYCYYGNGVLTDSLYYPGYWGVKNGGDLYPQNLEKAAEALAGMHYLDRDKDGIREDEAGNQLAIEILTNEGDESRMLASEQIADDLKKAGFAVTIRKEPQEIYLRSLQSLNYDIYLGGAKMGENYDLRPLLKSYSGNPAGYANEDLDEAMEVLRSMKDRDDKLGAYLKIKMLLQEELPYYPLVYKTYGVLTSLDFQGTVKPLFFHVYRDAHTWQYLRTVPEENTSETETEKTGENAS